MVCGIITVLDSTNTLTYLLLRFTVLSLVGTLLFLALALLEQSLWDQNLVLGWDRSKFQFVSVGPHSMTGSERRTAAQWSAGSHAFFVEHSMSEF